MQLFLKSSLPLLILSFGVSTCWGSLVSIGTVSSTGQGHGAVFASVTFQNTGTESGCVGSNTSGTAAFGNSNVFLGSAECGSGIAGGDETKGNGPSGLYTATNLGIQAGNSNNLSFSNLVVLFNGVQNQANPQITLTNLALDLFSTSGTLLGSFALPAPMTFTAFPGTGNAGFGFELDTTEAAQANALLAANPTLLIGSAATATGGNAGPETISFTTLASTPTGQGATPEPASMALMGAGLLAVALVGRSLKQRN